MDGDKEINITYETLFELLRTEKNRIELQKLSKTFFQDVVSYMNEKSRILEEAKTKKGLFVDEEREKAELQLNNIKKLLVELYEKREKKIIGMALDKSKVKSDITDTSALLEEESRMVDLLASVFDSQRELILFNILGGRLPYSVEAKEKIAEPAEKTIEQQTEGQKTEEELPKKENSKTKLVRFIYAVPRFIGPELETYGPFEEEDVANLPAEITSVLIAKGRAEEIKGG